MNKKGRNRSVRSLVEKAEKAKGEKAIGEAINLLSNHLTSFPDDLAVRHARAKLYIKMQQLGEAINDYHAVLKVNPEDRFAAAQIEQLSTIVRYTNTDIYASPNTNFDPWLE